MGDDGIERHALDERRVGLEDVPEVADEVNKAAEAPGLTQIGLEAVLGENVFAPTEGEECGLTLGDFGVCEERGGAGHYF